MKNKIILVTGWNATGKSAFAYRLAKRISTPYFNADAINETVGDGLGPESWEVYKKGNAVTFLLLTHIVERFLQVGKTCILERNFIQPEIEELKILFEKYSCKCLTYMFNGDLDVLGERYYKRERHWVHSKARDAGVMRRYPEHRKLMDVEVGQMIYVDATSFEKIDYEALFDVANKFLNNE
jgi:predicted kinase